MRFVRADSVCVCACALRALSQSIPPPQTFSFHRSKMGFDWDIFFQIYPQSIGESPPSTSWHFWTARAVLPRTHTGAGRSQAAMGF